MDEDGESLLKRLENDWEAVVSEVNAYCKNHQFDSDELLAIYDAHIDVFRRWSTAEAKKHSANLEEALQSLSFPVVSVLLRELWMNCGTETLKSELLGGLWSRCEKEIDYHAKYVAKLSNRFGDLKERMDDLKQRFYGKFTELMTSYDASQGRLNTRIKTPARNFFLNCLKADDSARRRDREQLKNIHRDSEEPSRTLDWFSNEDKERIAWIESTIQKLIEQGVFREEQVQVFRLRRTEGKGIKEVSKEVGRSDGFVSTNCRLVEKTLKELSRLQASEGGYYA